MLYMFLLPNLLLNNISEKTRKFELLYWKFSPINRNDPNQNKHKAIKFRWYGKKLSKNVKYVYQFIVTIFLCVLKYNYMCYILYM